MKDKPCPLCGCNVLGSFSSYGGNVEMHSMLCGYNHMTRLGCRCGDDFVPRKEAVDLEERVRLLVDENERLSTALKMAKSIISLQEDVDILKRYALKLKNHNQGDDQ